MGRQSDSGAGCRRSARIAGLEDREAAHFPAADEAVEPAIDAGAELPAFAERKLIGAGEHHAVRDVVRRERLLAHPVQRILLRRGAAESGDIARGDRRVVNHL